MNRWTSGWASSANAPHMIDTVVCPSQIQQIHVNDKKQLPPTRFYNSLCKIGGMCSNRWYTYKSRTRYDLSGPSSRLLNSKKLCYEKQIFHPETPAETGWEAFGLPSLHPLPFPSVSLPLYFKTFSFPNFKKQNCQLKLPALVQVGKDYRDLGLHLTREVGVLIGVDELALGKR